MGEIAEIVFPTPPDLQPAPDGHATEGAGYSLTLPAVATDPLRITNRDGQTLTMVPAEMAYRDGAGQMDYIVGSAPAQATVRAKEARYFHSFPAAEDVFVAQAEGVKHFTRLKDHPSRGPAVYLGSAIEFGFSYLIGGVPLPPGRHESIDIWGFNFPLPFADDLAKAMVSGYYEVIDSDQGQVLWIWFDAAWFADPDRVYPVTIDPTIIVSSQTTTGKRIVTLSTGRQVSFVKAATGFACYVSDDRGLSWLICTSPANGIVTAQTTALVADRDADDAIHIATASAAPAPVYYAQVKVAGRVATAVETQFETAPVTNFGWTPVEIIAKGGAGANKQVYVGCIQSATSTTGNEIWRRRVLTVTPAGACTVGAAISFTSTNTTNARQSGLKGALCMLANGDVWSILSNDKLDTSLNVLRVEKRVGEADFATVYSLNLISTPLRLVGVDGFAKPYWVAGFTNSAPGSGAIYDDVGLVAGLAAAGLNFTKNLTAVGDPAKNRIIIVGINDTTNFLRMAIFDLASKTVTSAQDIDTTIALSGSLAAVGGARVLAGPYYPLIFTNGTHTYSHTISFNQAPTMPTNLTIANFDATLGQRLTYTHNDVDGDAQASQQLEFARNDTGAIVLDVAKTSTPNQYYDIATNALPQNTQLKVRVMTWDTSDAPSPWSDWVTFYTSARPTAAITYPAADGAVFTGGPLTVKGTVSDPESQPPSGWQWMLTDNANNVLWDGLRLNSNSPPLQTVDFTSWINGATYKVKLTAWDNRGVASVQVVRTFTINLTTPANPANLSKTPRPGRASMSLSWAAPAVPTGVESGTYRVERKWATALDSTYRLLADNLAATTFEDTTVACGRAYTHRISSIGTNGVLSAGVTVTGTVTFPVPWLIHPTDSTQNLTLPLTASELMIQKPQTMTDVEPLGADRKSRSTGNVLGVESELTIICNHQNPRTYDLAVKLEAAKQLATTWLLKLPQHPGPLMANIPGDVYEVSLGASRIVKGTTRTVVSLPFLEVGDPIA